jgi:hypothetical protein
MENGFVQETVMMNFIKKTTHVISVSKTWSLMMFVALMLIEMMESFFVPIMQ